MSDDGESRLTGTIKLWLAGAMLAGSSIGGGASSFLGQRELALKLEAVAEGQAELKSDLREIRAELKEAAQDRWTRADHAAYAAAQVRMAERLDGRMDRLERALDARKSR